MVVLLQAITTSHLSRVDVHETWPGTDDYKEEEEEEVVYTTESHPLLFFFDCETTGFNVYNECITELAAKVIAVPVSSLSQPTFSRLVMTTKNIPDIGMYREVKG